MDRVMYVISSVKWLYDSKNFCFLGIFINCHHHKNWAINFFLSHDFSSTRVIYNCHGIGRDASSSFPNCFVHFFCLSNTMNSKTHPHTLIFHFCNFLSYLIQVKLLWCMPEVIHMTEGWWNTHIGRYGSALQCTTI